MLSKIIDYYLNLFEKSPLWNSVDLWRNLFLTLVALLSLLYLFRKKIKYLLLKKDITEHDKKIFIQSDRILSERNIFNSLSTIENYYRFDSDYLTKAEDFCKFFKDLSNSYIEKGLRKSSAKLVSSIKKLITFMVGRFFIEPRTQPGPNFTFELFPEDVDEIGRKTKRYLEAEKLLPKHTKAVRINYLKYRRTVKQSLIL